MADITISYKGNTIAEVSESGTTTFGTSGKYCEDDISIAYVQPNPSSATDITITYGESTIAEVSASGTTTLGTKGKYCTSNILLEYVRPSIQIITDDSIYLLRQLPYNSNAKTMRKIVGCSFAWNQLANNGSASVTSGHKYISCSSGTWSIGTSNGTAISADMVFDITLMFGSTIADYIYGLGSASCVAWFRNLFPSASYPYDAGSLLSVKTSASTMKNADESETSSYALDNTELRGIPKLDANNKLYYDGDEYTADGTVKRKYRLVTLNGDSTYNYTQNGQTSDTKLCYISFSDKAFGQTNMISDRFAYNASNSVAYSMRGRSGSNGVEFRLPSTVEYSVAGFKSWFASNPTTLIFELATPTTESATAYTQAQKCYPNGTEEFVDGRTVEIPVNAVADYEVTS